MSALQAAALLAIPAAALKLWLSGRQIRSLRDQTAAPELLVRTRIGALRFTLEMTLLVGAAIALPPDAASLWTVGLAVLLGWGLSLPSRERIPWGDVWGALLLWGLAACVAASLGPDWPRAWPLAWGVAVAVLAWRLLRPRGGPPQPLEDAELVQAVQDLAAPLGLRLSLLVDPAEGPPNAGIRGLGRHGRLIFQSSLLRLPRQTVMAVAAHELGHRAGCHHERYLLVQSLLALLAVAALVRMAGQVASPYHAVTLVVLARPLGIFLAGPLLCGLRRRYEFEADAVAARLTGPADFEDALCRLVKPAPRSDRWYEAFHHPYPAVEERRRKLHST